MRTKRYVALAAMALGLAAIVLGLSMRLGAREAQAATTATFTVNAPASQAVSTPFNVTVDLSGVTFDVSSPTWGGWDMELSYNTSVLQFNSITAHTAPPWTGLCPGSNWSGSESTGTIVSGCAFQSSTATTGMLEQINFTCIANGIGQFTLVPRPGVNSLGSTLFDENALDFGMTLVNDSITCGSGGPTATFTNTATATNTRTPTNTPVPTNTFTPTSTNTPCPPGGCPTNTPTNTPLPTNTPGSGTYSTATPTGTRSPEGTSTNTATSVPGAPTNTPRTGTGPGGGAGAGGGGPRITLPDTGRQASSGDNAMGGLWLLIGGVALATLGGGMLLTSRKRA